MNIPFLDLKRINAPYSEALLGACGRVIDSGWYILGNEVQDFEKKFADYCGAKHCVGVGNGLDALSLTFRAWMEMGRLKIGDEVLVPANTYIASILSISENGLTPILVEPCKKTFNITVDSLEKALTKKTKAILPVHLYGLISPMDEIVSFASQNNLLVLEDCAQSHGSSIDGVKSGVWGNSGAFSFYPGKNLGALGDGGAIVSNDDEFIKVVRAIRNYGSERKYENQYRGVNSRLDEMQAALLSVKLGDIDVDIDKRRAVAEYYNKNINNQFIQKPELKNVENHVWHLYVVKTKYRREFSEHLNNNGVGSLIHYPIPPHKQVAYSEILAGSYPISEEIHEQVISLPNAPYLTAEEMEYVVQVINNFEINE